jgi:hypothetical protein
LIFLHFEFTATSYMSVVSTTTMMAGPRHSDKDSTPTQNASGFTAVNREPLANGTSGRVEVVGKADHDSLDHREQQSGNQSINRHHSPQPIQDISHREMRNAKQQSSSPLEVDTPASSHGKRKRSSSDEGSGSSGSSHYDLTPPRRSSASPTVAVDTRLHRGQEGDRSHASYVNGSNGVDSHSTRDNDNSWPTDRHAPSGYQTNGHAIDASDAHLAEALQRETQAQNSQRTWGIGGRPDDDQGDQYGAYATDRTSQGAVQAGAKRKRVFSNRTKTGCMTCRKRKKKCDEGHPYCEYFFTTSIQQ